MLIIDLLGVSSVKVGKKVYSWGLLDSNQVIYLNINDELQSFLKKTKPITRTFTIKDQEVSITIWILKKKTGCAIPQDQLLSVAKLIIADHEQNYIEFIATQKQISISNNRSWFFTKKDAWYHFVFYMLYQEWDGHTERDEDELKEELRILDEIWEKKTDFKAFQKWIKTQKEFTLRCVGDKYHLEDEDLQKLNKGDTINLLTATFNKHDSKAIGIFLKNGKQLGFIRRPVAKILHDRLNFEDFTANICWIDKDKTPNNRILVKVMFKSMSTKKIGKSQKIT